MATITALHVYCGSPSTSRGEVTKLGIDPTGATDDISYASGRVAVVRSTSSPLKSIVFAQHTHPVTVVRIAPCGTAVASADEGGFVRLWDRATLKQKAEMHVSAGPIRDLAFSADGKSIVIAGDARGAYAKGVKIPSGGSAGICSGHTKRAIACDVSPTRPSLVATGSEDMSVGIFKGPPIREIDIPKFLRHHSAFVNDVRFSPDGAKLAIASSDRTISVVDVASCDVLSTFEGHKASITGLCWSRDGSRLLSSGNDKTNMLWDIATGTCVQKTEFGTNVLDMQVGCALLPKSGRVASIALRGDITFRDATSDKPDAVFRGHSKQIVGLSVVGGKAYTADYSGIMVAWDIGVGPSRATFSGKGPATSVCALDANKSIIANVGQDGKVFVTPTSTLEYAKPLSVKGGGADVAVPQGANAPIAAAVLNESRVALATPDGSDILTTFDFAHGEKGYCIAVTADASLFAVGVEVAGGGGELRFLKLTSDTLAQDGDAIRMPSPPNRLAFSPDGSVLALGEKSRRVKMYDVASRTSVPGGGTAHTARVDAVAFAADGKRVATGGMDGSIAVWTVDSDDEPLRMQAAHRNGVTGLAYVDEHTILSSGGDCCLRSWKI